MIRGDVGFPGAVRMLDNPPDPIPDHVLNYAEQDEALKNLHGE
jgi:hypothetical protein